MKKNMEKNLAKNSSYFLYQDNIVIKGHDGLWEYQGLDGLSYCYCFAQYSENRTKIKKVLVSNLSITCLYHKGMDTPLWKILNQ